MLSKRGKKILGHERVCSHCGTIDSPQFVRVDGKVYCNRHYLQIKNKGKIQERTNRDRNTYSIDIENSTVTIDLRNIKGEIIDKTVIDIEDFDIVKDYKWSKNANGYAICMKKKSQGGEHVFMHRLIMNCHSETIVDHKDRNTLNNRKNNLRIADKSKNNMNKCVLPNNTSGVTGVSYHKRLNKWEARIGYKNKSIYLGIYKNKEDAIKARQEAEIKYFGEFRRAK